MRAVVFINGVIDDYATCARWLRVEDYIVAADGGAHHALALGCHLNAVVGDLDSLEPELVARLAENGVELVRYPVHKNETDLELAIEFALQQKVDEVLLMGAIGGRLDQTLANLLILAQREWPVQLTLIEGHQLAQLLRPGETLVLQALPGDTVSALPLSDTVTGITYTGMSYPLTNATLHLGSTRGVSNEVATTPATATIATGRLLIIQTLASF